MTKRIVLILFRLFLCTLPVFSQFNSLLSLRVAPRLNIPLGTDAEDYPEALEFYTRTERIRPG